MKRIADYISYLRRHPKQANKWRLLLFIALEIAGVCMVVLDAELPGFIAMIAGLVIYTALTLALWRCPRCGSSLPWRDVFIEYCPHCGERLD